MGNSESSEQKSSTSTPTPSAPSPPPPPKLLKDEPWRKFNADIWTEEYHEQTISGLKDRFLGSKSVKSANAVLLGPIGSGKSAFVNSTLSIGNTSVLATADSSQTEKSCTTKLGVYKHRCATFGNMKLFDTMGLEAVENEGFNLDDITLLLEGHVPKDYKFNPRNPITPNDKVYIKKPKAADKTHCVIFCIKASLVSRVSSIPKELLRKIAQLQEKIKEIGIPRIVLVTHIDEVCPEVAKDISKIFHSIAAEEAVNGASNVFKLAPSYIHPVENYHKSTEPDRKSNIPLLLALRHMLDLADDYFVRTNPGEKSICSPS